MAKTGVKNGVERLRQQSWTSGSWWADRLQERLPGPASRIMARARRNDVLLMAGGLAFYALVSVVPLVIVSLWITALLVPDGRIEAFADKLSKLAPESIGIDTAVKEVANKGTSLGGVAALLALWPASAYGSGLAQAFDHVTPNPDRRRSGILGRGLLVLALLPLLIVGTVLAAYVGSKVLGDALVGQILGLALALVGAFLVAAAVMVFLYRVFAPERLQWHAVLKGTAFTAAGVAVLSLLFVLYLSLGANFEERYASSSMAAVVFVAIWLYLANVLLLIGYKIALESDPTSRQRRPRG